MTSRLPHLNDALAYAVVEGYPGEKGRVALRELQMTDGIQTIANDLLATRAAEGACPLCGVARPDCEHVVWAKGVSGQEEPK